MAGQLNLELPRRGARYRLESGDSPRSVTIVDGATGDVAGTVEAEVSGATLEIFALCVDETRRGYGAGSEAARLLIDAASEAGFTRITAWAPPDNGLAVYFWYRMGLRAVHGEGPNGGLAFERGLATG